MLTVRIPDSADIRIPNQGQSNEEIRRSLIGLGYSQVETAQVRREGDVVIFTRPQGGDKGASRA
jgi:hypothetical protein